MIKPKASFLIVISFMLISIFGYSADKFPQKYGTNLYGTLYNHRHNYDGSAYLYDNWLYGGIFLENGTEATNVLLRYDMLEDNVVFYHEKEKLLFAVDKSTVKSFYLIKNDRDTVFFQKHQGKKIDSRIQNNDYLQILYKGKLQFIARHNAIISLATDSKTQDEIIQQHFYYLKKDNRYYEIDLNYRSLFKLFPDRKKEIKKLIKKNYLRRRKESNMAELISLIDQSRL